MSEKPPLSLELLAANKMVARECSSEALAYLRCKQRDSHPKTCEQQATLVIKCSDAIVRKVKTTLSQPFTEMVRCIDDNDFNIYACQKQHRSLLDAYNTLEAKS